MIRDMLRNGAQPKNTMYKAKEAMVTGMGVVKEAATKEVKVPGAEEVANIYVVTKERVPSGMNAARANMSDYDEDFVNIKAGEFVGLERYTDGEKFATDQYKTTDFAEGAFAALKGKPVSVGADGKWQKATKPSKYVFEDIFMDNGHRLVMIRVEADAVSNA